MKNSQNYFLLLIFVFAMCINAVNAQNKKTEKFEWTVLLSDNYQMTISDDFESIKFGLNDKNEPELKTKKVTDVAKEDRTRKMYVSNFEYFKTFYEEKGCLSLIIHTSEDKNITANSAVTKPTLQNQLINDVRANFSNFIKNVGNKITIISDVKPIVINGVNLFYIIYNEENSILNNDNYTCTYYYLYDNGVLVELQFSYSDENKKKWIKMQKEILKSLH